MKYDEYDGYDQREKIKDFDKVFKIGEITMEKQIKEIKKEETEWGERITLTFTDGKINSCILGDKAPADFSDTMKGFKEGDRGDFTLTQSKKNPKYWNITGAVKVIRDDMDETPLDDTPVPSTTPVTPSPPKEKYVKPVDEAMHQKNRSMALAYAKDMGVAWINQGKKFGCKEIAELANSFAQYIEIGSWE